jgi:hypothetical protein
MRVRSPYYVVGWSTGDLVVLQRGPKEGARMNARLCRCDHAHALCGDYCHPPRGVGLCDYTRTCIRPVKHRFGGLRYCAYHWRDVQIVRTAT